MIPYWYSSKYWLILGGARRGYRHLDGDGSQHALGHIRRATVANSTPALHPCREQDERLDAYEACGEAASNCSIGSQTKAVWATERPAIWIVCSATDLPPNRW
jgi:hypothetical protein